MERYWCRRLCQVWAGKGEDRKTGWLLGGHDKGDVFIKCTSSCCATASDTLAEGKLDAEGRFCRTGGGCIMTCAVFEKHAGCGSHKKWKASIHTCSSGQSSGSGGAPREGELGAAGADDDPALAVAHTHAPDSGPSTAIAWMRSCGRELERRYRLAADQVYVWVFWPAVGRYGAWFKGKVVSFDESSRADREMFCTHRVEYEDGDVEDLHLAQELFSLRPPPEWTQQQQPEEQQQEPGQQQQEPGQQQEQQQEPGPGQRGAGVQQATAEDSEGDQEQRQQASGSPGTCAAAAAPRRRGKKRRHRGTPVPRGHGQQAQAGLPVQPAAAAAAVDLPAPLHQAGPPAPQQQPAAAAAAGPPRSLADRMAAAIQACQQQPAAVDAGLSSTVWEEYLGKWQGFDPAVQGSALNVVEQVLKEGQFAILSVIVDDLLRGLA